MGTLQGKKILLGITGGIAAYKSVYLLREFVKAGAEVQVLMTRAAHDFVTPTTLSTLSGKPVLSDTISDKDSGEWADHIQLGEWADLMVVAPATANTIAKIVHGQSDDLLMAVYLSLRCPLLVAPAMDLEMYAHEATQANITGLLDRGHFIVGPDKGELASGLRGEGRMSEPEEIFNRVQQLLQPESKLNGKKVLVTAGPTFEAIDPVRFIGNRSSGKMGYAIAEEAKWRGAEVKLVSGPSNEKTRTELIKVESAQEMLEACQQNASADLVIMAAAVADVRPADVSDEKIKKDKGLDRIELTENPDILKWFGENRKESQLIVGFALETQNEVENARNKLERKGVDMIVLNSLKDEGAGFAHDTNKVTLIFKEGEKELPLASKKEIAAGILDQIELML